MAKFEKGQSGNPSGRPKGSGLASKVREAAQEHTQSALAVLVEVMEDSGHPQRLKAAELILARGHGAPRETPPSLDIINRFVAGEISAISACLMLEAEGLKVPEVLRVYFDNELKAASHVPFAELENLLDSPPQPLPRR